MCTCVLALPLEMVTDGLPSLPGLAWNWKGISMTFYLLLLWCCLHTRLRDGCRGNFDEHTNASALTCYMRDKHKLIFVREQDHDAGERGVHVLAGAPNFVSWPDRLF